MKRSIHQSLIANWQAYGSTFLSVGSVAALLSLFANCAANDEQGSVTPDAGVTQLQDAAVSAVDAGSDANAPCDAGDPSCSSEVPSCDQVDWCMVAAGVSPSERLGSVWGSSKTDVWAVGSRGSAVHYDGSKWTPAPIGNKSTFFGVWGSGPNDVWAVSDSQTMMHTDGFKNGAVTWTLLDAPSPVDYFASVTTAIFGFGPNDLRIGTTPTSDYATNTFGNMLVKKVGNDEEDGIQVTRVGGLAGTVTGIWGSSPEDIWILVDNRQTSSNYQGKPFEAGKIMHGKPTTDPTIDKKGDKLAWTTVDSQSTVVLHGIWGSSASDVWAVGDHGTIRHIYPNDTRWQIIDSPTIENLRGVWGTAPNDVWVVGDAGTILHYDGFEFKQATSQLPVDQKPNLYGVWGSSANDVWIVGEKAVLHFEGAKASSGGRP